MAAGNRSPSHRAWQAPDDLPGVISRSRAVRYGAHPKELDRHTKSLFRAALRYICQSHMCTVCCVKKGCHSRVNADSFANTCARPDTHLIRRHVALENRTSENATAQKVMPRDTCRSCNTLAPRTPNPTKLPSAIVAGSATESPPPYLVADPTRFDGLNLDDNDDLSITEIADPSLGLFVSSNLATSQESRVSQPELATGIKLTIGISVVAGAAVLFALGFWAVRLVRNRKQGESKDVASPSPREQAPPPPPLDLNKTSAGPDSSPYAAYSPAISSPLPVVLSPRSSSPLSPPPRLRERRMHHATHSDSAIDVTRSLQGAVPMKQLRSPSTVTVLPLYNTPAPSQVEISESLRSPPFAKLGPISPVTGTWTAPATPMSNASGMTDTPPQTPLTPTSPQGLANPGPPPQSALPPTPTSKSPISTYRESVLPEQIGIALGSPGESAEALRVAAGDRSGSFHSNSSSCTSSIGLRSRLNDEDMEKLAGTY